MGWRQRRCKCERQVGKRDGGRAGEGREMSDRHELSSLNAHTPEYGTWYVPSPTDGKSKIVTAERQRMASSRLWRARKQRTGEGHAPLSRSLARTSTSRPSPSSDRSLLTNDELLPDLLKHSRNGGRGGGGRWVKERVGGRGRREGAVDVGRGQAARSRPSQRRARSPLSHGLFRPPAFRRMDGYLEGKAQSQERPLNKQKEGPEAFR